MRPYKLVIRQNANYHRLKVLLLMLNILLVDPAFPPSYWSQKYALEFIDRKSSMPSLALLTVAGLFPLEHKLKLIDLNVETLRDEHLQWCDYVFISAMLVQKESFAQVVKRCNSRNVPVVAGGPYVTSFYDSIQGVDYFVLGEVEDVFLDFLRRLESGTAPHITQQPTDGKGRPIRPDITKTPPPRYSLVDLRPYGSVSLQFSRGCPYDCEFCDITKLLGRIPRTKTNEQMTAELQLLYDCGWRGTVFLVDDNFIGNRHNVRRLLPALAAWQKQKKYPFSFYTESSVDLAEMPELMDGMADAGFDMVFLGLETPNPNALRRVNKNHNLKDNNPDYLLRAVHTIQQHGMEVSAGFIIGLDGDDLSGFDAMISFIQKAGIPTAMVGLLTALKGTKLYERYKQEGRLLDESTGNNVSACLNYIPEINRDVLLAGYKRVLAALYDSSMCNYFDRCFTLVKNWDQRRFCGRSICREELVAFAKSIRIQLFSRQGRAYVRFLTRVLCRRPKMFGEAVRLAIMGYHYEKVTRQQIMVDEFRSYLEIQLAALQQQVVQFAKLQSERIPDIRTYLEQCCADIELRYRAINEDFRTAAREALLAFQEQAQALLAQFGQTLKL
jgi:radical SAM superfamily enzyme YgiQ (UPF0313 family)